MDKEDVLYVYKGILVSQKKKNEIMSSATTWMDVGIITLSEVSQRKTNIMISFICGSKKVI